MTLFYQTQSWSSQPSVSKETKKIWECYSKKKNWRITQLPNGYYQSEWKDLNNNWSGITRRETIEGAEKAIESSIEHYEKKLKLAEGPIIVKTFE
jgi:hypothetical protein